MKKTYMIPTTELVTINSDVVLTGGSITLNATGGTGTVFDENATSESLSRHASVWGDDEEENF